VHPGLHWARHRLAPGVVLDEVNVSDSRGVVPVHVVVADLGNRDVGLTSLHRSLASRSVLTSLANRRRVVAAVNGMYFSFAYGAPVVPFIEHGRAQVLTTRPQQVVGLAGRSPQAGLVWLAGAVRVGTQRTPLVAVNSPTVHRGLAVYTSAWGSRPVPIWHSSRSRQARDGRVLTVLGRRRTIARGGWLLVATGASAVHWLRNAHKGQPVGMSRQIETDAPKAFTQAYGVGTHLVAAPFQTLPDRYCRAGSVEVARTAIGWAFGRYLVLVVVGNPRRKHQHGLDENQMSGLLASFGASQAYALDGGGSSEMVARLGRHRRLSIRNAPSDGRQRAIPIGLGVTFSG